ncbi:hypothetical protein OOK41_31780 [Micromonospora sp. NBC_01655]|uniref:hypothetical protein n=1 Tax=Micromonospora sp. NBC_01655 TaxID=2975983 RepID=UPI00225AA1CB|nr:hypothetical protein [Micromonospora sp. NBC_01655]MCX4474842.1 hypothetical protein [Micromonospora sp. NBC_01655]
MSTDELAPLHPDATGLTLFRALPNDDCRAYSEVEFTQGRAGVARFLHRLRALGYIRNSSADPKSGYGVLDVLNADGDIVQDYEVTSSRAHAYIKRKLRLTVVRPPAEAAR